jgi:hypothetical protein
MLAKHSSNLSGRLAEIGSSQRGPELLNTEAERATAWEAVTRQPVKTQNTEKTYYVL